MDDRKTIGANFKRHIKANAISQREAADRIGISAPHLANLLNGVENMGYIVVKKIVAAFPEVSAEYLLTGEGVLVPPPGTVRISQSQKVSGGGTGIQTVAASLGHSYGPKVTMGYVTIREKLVDDAVRKLYDYVAGTWAPEK